MASPEKLPVAAIVVTKNEARNIERCLRSLNDFEEIIVVDSDSTDSTATLAERQGAQVISYRWDGRYPKKRQWCLENIGTRSDWIFFIDADEEATPEFITEIRSINWRKNLNAGFFVKARYALDGRILKHGFSNNKLCILHKKRMAFPVVNDLDFPGMGEIEGHYQPILKTAHASAKIGRIRAPIFHHALDDEKRWTARHERYAAWEVAMDKNRAWPRDPLRPRRAAKFIFKALPFRPAAAFLHSWVWRMGMLDGRAGLAMASARARYYRMIDDLKRQ